jgi:hypothetical protein
MFSDNITFIEARQGDRRNGKANTAETFTKLGWTPEMNLVKWIQQVKQ